MVYLSQALEENSLCIEQFHRGRFVIGRKFEEITFCSKDTLTQWRGSLSRMRYYAMEGSDGKDDIDTEGAWYLGGLL